MYNIELVKMAQNPRENVRTNGENLNYSEDTNSPIQELSAIHSNVEKQNHGKDMIGFVSEFEESIELNEDDQWERVNYFLMLVASILTINTTVLFSWIIIINSYYRFFLCLNA